MLSVAVRAVRAVHAMRHVERTWRASSWVACASVVLKVPDGLGLR
jgi:hypothetical protein